MKSHLKCVLAILSFNACGGVVVPAGSDPFGNDPLTPVVTSPTGSSAPPVAATPGNSLPDADAPDVDSEAAIDTGTANDLFEVCSLLGTSKQPPYGTVCLSHTPY